jgi:ATP-dependent RNA helicase DDX21
VRLTLHVQAAATTVRHLMLPAHWQQRTQLVKDLITSYGCGGRTIVFTDTKSDAGSLALALQET